MGYKSVRSILDANPLVNSVTLFNTLKWIPIDDTIRIRKLCMMYRIMNNMCPQYFDKHINYVKDRHDYCTRASTNNKLVLPKCRTSPGLRCFHVSAARLWNELNTESTNLSGLVNFKKYLVNNVLSENENRDHFQVTQTF